MNHEKWSGPSSSFLGPPAGNNNERTSTSPPPSSSSSGGETFPKRLRRMLDEAHSRGFDHIVGWVGERHFRVFDRHAFEQTVVQNYFFSTKYKSFTRQLNLYGFQRVQDKHSPLEGCYWHALFRRDRPELVSCILRQKAAGGGDEGESAPIPPPAALARPPHERLAPFQGRRSMGEGGSRQKNTFDDTSHADNIEKPASVSAALSVLCSTDATERRTEQPDAFLRIDEPLLLGPARNNMWSSVEPAPRAPSLPSSSGSSLLRDWISRVPEDIQEEILRTFR